MLQVMAQEPNLGSLSIDCRRYAVCLVSTHESATSRHC